jgi:hypothetical protein
VPIVIETASANVSVSINNGYVYIWGLLITITMPMKNEKNKYELLYNTDSCFSLVFGSWFGPKTKLP